MKKNKHFQLKNTLWPMIFLLIMVAASLFSNRGLVNGVQGIPETKAGKKRQAAKAVHQLAMTQRATQNQALSSVAVAVQENISAVVSKVNPCVVTVLRKDNPFQQKADGLSYLNPYVKGNSIKGSGVIVDQRGYIITSYRTVGKDSTVRVKLYREGRSTFKADVVTVDPNTDLALLKIRKKGFYPTPVLGNSDLLEVGDFVFAIGSPYGFSSTVTMGIVSSNGRTTTIDGIKYPEMIQTDAPVNAGSDGGPLVNIKGEVVGINIACYMPDNHFTGIGFAIPVSNIQHLLTKSVM